MFGTNLIPGSEPATLLSISTPHIFVLTVQMVLVIPRSWWVHCNFSKKAWRISLKYLFNSSGNLLQNGEQQV